MERLKFVLAGCFIACTILEVPYTVAVHGNNVSDATNGEFPFVVSLKHRSANKVEDSPEKLIFCTGTLITKRHVLTAEHCLSDERPDEVEVVIGSVTFSEGEIYYPKSWISYNQWAFGRNASSYFHDVAIVLLNKTVDNENAKVAKLLLSAPCARPGAHVKLVGWGFTDNRVHPTNLKTARSKLLSREDCKRKAARLGDTGMFLQQYLCTWADPYVLLDCGDSGGPLLNELNMVIGINRANCPSEKLHWVLKWEWDMYQTNIHTSIYYYKTFITEVMKTLM